MPPRADLDHYAPDASIGPRPRALGPTVERAKFKPKSSAARRPRRPPRVLFRNAHGISGALSTLLTALAISTERWLPSSLTCTATSVLAVVASVVAAASGASIVDRAPMQTVVMERPFRVVPPHRDAFRRTAYSVYYLGARICWNAAKLHGLSGGFALVAGEGDADAIDWVWSCVALSYAIRYFVPRPADLDWRNGNTYAFVIPMALGLTADATMQLPVLQCYGDLCWNADIITQFDLLCILLSGLVIAFVFTLAFRGVLGIRNCY